MEAQPMNPHGRVSPRDWRVSCLRSCPLAPPIFAYCVYMEYYDSYWRVGGISTSGSIHFAMLPSGPRTIFWTFNLHDRMDIKSVIVWPPTYRSLSNTVFPNQNNWSVGTYALIWDSLRFHIHLSARLGKHRAFRCFFVGLNSSRSVHQWL